MLSGLWSLRLFPSSECPSFHPYSVWRVGRTEPPNRATQNMCTHIHPHACIDTDLSHAFLPKPLSSFSRFHAACQAQGGSCAGKPSQQPWDQPPVLKGKRTPSAFLYFIEASRAPKDKPQEITHILLQEWFPFPLLLGLETIPSPSTSLCSGEELLRR